MSRPLPTLTGPGVTSLAPGPVGRLGSLSRRPLVAVRARRARVDAAAADLREVDALVAGWRQACIGAGVAQQVDTPTGPAAIAPRVVDVTLGPPASLVVQLLPGQVLADLRAVGYRLAPWLGAVALRIVDERIGHVRVDVLAHDPLPSVLPLQIRGDGLVHVATTEYGEAVLLSAEDMPHMVLQGQTRSGKSAATYGLLVQLLGDRDDPRVVIAGVDASGLTLRPFTGTRHARWQACGLGDPARLEGVLVALVAEMDRRIAGMPDGCDKVVISPEQPVIVVVLEEWPGVLRALDAIPAPKGETAIGKRVRQLVARLLAESHKAGLRVILIAQRAEATIIGGAERAQCGLRMSLRVDSPDSVRLLHTTADPELSGRHTTAEPGAALLEAPGVPLCRARAPYLGSAEVEPYAAFWGHVRAASCGVSPD